MIKVLVVEDSAVVREFLVHILRSDSEIQVVGTANNGEEALDAVKQTRPDVITMDINMPKMNGFEATRQIMETVPTPIVIVSGSSSGKEVATTFHAIEAGALAFVSRPKGFGHAEHAEMAEQLVRTVRLMSEVKVVRRWARHRVGNAALTAIPEVQTSGASAGVEVVAIGASTGGPIIIQNILSQLSKDFPVPMLVVQHTAPGFIAGFGDWLAQSTGFPVHIAAHDEYPLPGHAYVAPDGVHMGAKIGGRIMLSKDEPENGLRPSVSFLFRSVAEIYGRNAVGVLLSGMGRDGAEELKSLKEKGALTIAQDKESSVVHGMPGEAIKLDAATHVLSADKIAPALETFVKRK